MINHLLKIILSLSKRYLPSHNPSAQMFNLKGVYVDVSIYFLFTIYKVYIIKFIL